MKKQGILRNKSLIVCYSIYNEEQFLRPSLLSIYEIADFIVIVDGKVELFDGKYAFSSDNTYKIIKEIDVDNKINLIKPPGRPWKNLLEKTQQFYKLWNIGDWILHVSGDEILRGKVWTMKDQLAFLDSRFAFIRMTKPFLDYNGQVTRLIKNDGSSVPLTTTAGEINPGSIPNIPTLQDIYFVHYKEERNEVRKLLKREYLKRRHKL